MNNNEKFMPSSCQSDGRRANQTVMRENAKRSGGLGNAGNGVRHPTNLLVHYNHTQPLAEKSRSPWKPAETANSGGRGGESKEARRHGGKEARKQGQAQEGRQERLRKSWKSLGKVLEILMDFNPTHCCQDSDPVPSLIPAWPASNIQ